MVTWRGPGTAVQAAMKCIREQLDFIGIDADEIDADSLDAMNVEQYHFDDAMKSVFARYMCYALVSVSLDDCFVLS